MLLSVSMANVFMSVLAFSRFTVSLTFITPVPGTSKRILRPWRKAKEWRYGWYRVAPDCRRRASLPLLALRPCGPARPQGAFLRPGPATRRFSAGHVGNALDHHHEQHSAFIPPAQPAHAPAIQVIAKLDRLEKPQELRFNMHSPLRTCMARQS